MTEIGGDSLRQQMLSRRMLSLEYIEWVVSLTYNSPPVVHPEIGRFSSGFSQCEYLREGLRRQVI